MHPFVNLKNLSTMKTLAFLTAALLTAGMSFGQASTVGDPGSNGNGPGLHEPGNPGVSPCPPNARCHEMGLGGQDLQFSPQEITAIKSLISKYRKGGDYSSFMSELSTVLGYNDFEVQLGLKTDGNLEASLGRLTALLSIAIDITGIGVQSNTSR